MDHHLAKYLTPAEVMDLRLIAARARMDQGDLYPMRSSGEVIPWVDALNMEVGSDD